MPGRAFVAAFFEMSQREICGAIGCFGTRKGISYGRFRHIRWWFLDCRKTFPDQSDVETIRAMRVTAEAGGKGRVTPQHAASTGGGTGGSWNSRLVSATFGL